MKIFLPILIISAFSLFPNGFLIAESKINRQERLEQLKSLPYVSWTSEKADPFSMGVVHHNEKESYKGYNFFTDDRNNVLLMDMDGKFVYRWVINGYSWCEDAHLFPNGDVLAVCVEKALVKVDKNSNILWKYKSKANHDVEVRKDGTIVVITKKYHSYKGRTVDFHALDFLSPSGKFLSRWSSYDNVEMIRKFHHQSPLEYETEKNIKKKFDYYHMNTVQVLQKTDLGLKDPRFKEDNLLVCFRNVNLIAILDKDSMEIVWSWGIDDLDYPHMPQLLPGGTMLVYDNGPHRDHTRIIELNPVTKKIIWSYKGDPPASFHSEWRGSNQRLPNGNTLICESEKGRAFEINKDGKIVWNFWNPITNKKGKRKRIYRLERVDFDYVKEFIGN